MGVGVVVWPASLEWLWLPWAACLLLTAIHAWLGIHVLQRQIIFVDLALAQMAALGAAVAIHLGHSLRSDTAYACALAFAIFGSVLLTLTRTKSARVPQEALIGVIYVVAAASAIVMFGVARDAHGAEHLKDLLAGDIVWVTPDAVGKTAVIYAIVGAFHVAFRRRFLELSGLLSSPPSSAPPSSAFPSSGGEWRGRGWDFAFYLSFAVVITSSVQMAGVLLVFAFLVVPAVIAGLFASRIMSRLLVAWGIGAGVSFGGLVVSYDLPSGPVIIVFFGAALLVAGAIYSCLTAKNWRTAALRLAVPTGAVVALGVVMALILTPPSTPPPATVAARDDCDHPHHHHQHHHPPSGASFADSPAASAGLPSEWPTELRASVLALTAAAEADRLRAYEALQSAPDPRAIPALKSAMSRETADWAVLQAAKALVNAGDTAAVAVVLELMLTGPDGGVRFDALDFLAPCAGTDFAYDPFAPTAEATGKWRHWLASRPPIGNADSADDSADTCD